MSTDKKRNIFLRALSSFWTFLDESRRSVVNVIFLFIVIAILSSVLGGKDSVVPKGAALIINPTGYIVEQKDYSSPIEKAIDEATSSDKPPQTSLKDILDAIRNGAGDKRIKLLVIDTGSMLGGGMTKLQAIGEAIDEFKESGKPVIAKSTFYGQSQYYLASHADEVFLDPEGAVIIEGFGRYRTYYKELLDNLEIDYHIFKVGTFKSAVEPYMRNNMSDKAKQANLRWLTVLWDSYKKDVALARDLKSEEIESYVVNYPELITASSGDNAKIAIENKLVDALKNNIEFRSYMVEKVGKDKKGESYKRVSMKKYLKSIRPAIELYDDNSEKVALIIAKGVIMDGEQVEGTIGGTTLARLIRKARTNDSVKALVLRVDSPGGSAFASEVIRREILATKAAGKKVVISMGTYAASGGYWISANADEIWARPTTITGSIGIFGMFPTINKPLNKIGIYRDGIGTTPLAGAFDIARPLAPEMGVMIQQIINHGYDNFLDVVATGRGMTREEVDKIGQGRVWIGLDAHKLGLVDKLGSLQDAIDSAAKMVGISEDYELYPIKRELSDDEILMQQLFSKVDFDFGKIKSRDYGVLSKITGFATAELERLATLNDPQGLYLNCLCTLDE